MMVLRFELGTFGFDTMLNHHLSQKLKLMKIGKFNHLIIILIYIDQGPKIGLGSSLITYIWRIFCPIKK